MNKDRPISAFLLREEYSVMFANSFPKIVLVIFFSLLAIVVNAQNSNYITIDKSANGKLLSTLVREVEYKYDVDIAFQDKTLRKKRIKGITRPMSLMTFLKAFLPNKYIVDANKDMFLVLDYRVDLSNSIVTGVKKNGSFFRGRVYDVLTGEAIEGASIVFIENNSGTVTSSSGEFMSTSSKDIIIVDVSFIGYNTQRVIISSSTMLESKVADIPMESSSSLLGDVLVTAKRHDENIKIETIGIQKIGIATIKEMPTFLGEVDPIKSIATLPGVSTNGDLGSGFSVRGSENSQNLILQDGAIIFNPTHLFGFFSVFNPDFIKEISLLKGGGPAMYGGRVASVMNIETSTGDVTDFSVSGGVGLISSRLTLEGPINKGKSSFKVGGRVSYSDWFLKMFDDIQLNNSSAKFHDITASFFQQINEKSFITVTGYYSHDEFKLGVDSTFSWTTKNISVNWDHKYSEDSRSRLTLASSNYDSGVLHDNRVSGFDYMNGINVLTANYGHSFKVGEKTTLNLGVNNNFSKIRPGKSTAYNGNENYLPIEIRNQKTIESSIFAQVNFELNDRISVNVGLRYSQFWRLGEDEIYSFDYENPDGRTPSIVDTTYYEHNDVVASYGGLEPRVSVRYLIGESASLKAGYNKTQQFLHQISTTTSPTPVDYWISSSVNILPQRSNHFSLGYFQNFDDDIFETSIEGFYSNTDNAIDYISGVDLHLNPAVEGGVIQGDGYAYGVEFMVKKNQGKLNGWVAYTYSRSYRVMKGKTSDFDINNGEPYRSSFDQPHQLSVILNWRINNQVVLSSNFTYNTGRPITIPISKYSYGNSLAVKNYSARNEYRMPDYHRLDLSLTISSKKKPNKKFSSEVVVSLFNVYARHNAYEIYFNEYGRGYKTYILGSIVPSVSYNFKIN
ncbi:MAG: TonB-dependent receptor [Flavobacteriales bacterium]|nr:TonB-dependent receptor [Flavobacteriales bacterium]